MAYHAMVCCLCADSAGEEITMYTWGKRDVFSAFFYFLIWIVIHAVIQEYILDVSV
jgi:translocating chain-associated membrane protein 1